MTREELLAEKSKIENEIIATGDPKLIAAHISPARLNELKQAELERSAQNIDEMHPDISFADRAIVKNFASSPESSIAYLQKQHPDMVFKNSGGEILARNKNEANYKKLDPSGFDLQDITDIGSDIVQGGLDTAGSAIGGLGGAISGMGVGAVPGAIAGRALVGAGTELAKQDIGSALGIPNNANGANVLLNGTANAVLPVIGKGLGKAYDYTKSTIAPNLASYLSGIDKDILKNINIDTVARDNIKAISENTYLKNISRTMGNGLKATGNGLGTALNNATGKQIDLTPVRDYVLSSANGRGIWDNQKENISELINHFKGKEVGPIIDSVEQGRYIRDVMKGAKVNEELLPTTRAIANNAYEMTKGQIANSAPDRKAFDIANNAYANFQDTVEENPMLRSFVSSKGTNNEAVNLQNLIDKNYTDYGLDQATAKLKADQALDFLQKNSGQDVGKIAREVTSAKLFNDPKMIPSGFLPRAKAGGLGSAIGAGIGYLSGGGLAAGIPLTIGGGLAGEVAMSPWAIKKAATGTKSLENMVNKGMGRVNPYVLQQTPKTIYNMMSDESN